MLGIWPAHELSKYGLDIEIAYNADFSNKVECVNIASNLLWLYGHLAVFPSLSPEDKQAVNDRVDKVTAFLTDYTLAACLGEARHMLTSIRGRYYGYLPSIPSILLPMCIQHSTLGRANSASSVWKDVNVHHPQMTIADVLNDLEIIFTLLTWNPYVGGPAWGYISSIGRQLAAAANMIEKVIALDRLSHAAHCGATFLTSWKLSFARPGYIGGVLTFKRRALLCCWPHVLGKQNMLRSFPIIPFTPAKNHPAHHVINPYISCEYKNLEEEAYIRQMERRRIQFIKGEICSPI